MLVYEWPKFSDTNVYAHIFRMKGYINSKDSIWISQLSVKSSIWMGCFFKGQVYDWGWFQNAGSHIHTKTTPELLPRGLFLRDPNI